MIFRFNPTKKYTITPSVINILDKELSAERYQFNFNSEYTKTCNSFSAELVRILNPDNGIIDGDSLKKLIFPTGGWDFDVFISHSHNNLVEAKKLAKYLIMKKHRHPFLDNYVWGSADALLKEIDNRYCIHSNGKSYDYDKRNFSTSHVHSMLSMAIFEMIAQCESFIFIDSNESIDYNQLKDDNIKTLSPWLHQELQYARMLSIVSNRPINEQKMFAQGGKLQINYGINLDDFTRLTATSLKSLQSL